MERTVLVDGRPRTNEWLSRHGLRRCFTCKKVKPRSTFVPGSRKCKRCRIGTRTCRICSIEKLLTEYDYRCTACRDCRALPGVKKGGHHPRACLRCWIVKPVCDFPLGEGKLKTVCTACREDEQREREQRAAERSNRFEHPITGDMMRSCTQCPAVLVEADGFYVGRRREDGSIERYDSYCKVCRRRQVKASHAAALADPVRGPRLRKQRNRWSAEWRQRDPEASAEAQRKYREARAANPILAAQDRENRRIDYRARREREGEKPREVKEAPRDRAGYAFYLPAGPLAGVVIELAVRNATTEKAQCEALAIDPRNLYGWRTGERESVMFDVADRVLTAAGRGWWEVWPSEEYPQVHEQITGEAVTLAA